MCLLGVIFFHTERHSVESIDLNIVEKTSAQTKTSQARSKMLFVGDIMLDRVVAINSERKGVDSLFYKIRDLLTSSDLTVGNLEGPINR